MYCNNCGYDIPADSAFCPVCGITNQTLQTHTYAQSPEIPASSSKKGILLLLIGVLIIAVATILVFFFRDSKIKSPEDIIADLEKAYNKQDIEYFFDILPDYYEKDLREEFKEYYPNEKEFWEEIVYYNVYLEPEAISSYKTDFKIVDKIVAEEEDCQEMEEEIQYSFGEDVSVSEAYALDLEITFDVKLNEKYFKDSFDDYYKEYLEEEYGEDWKKGVEMQSSTYAVLYKSDGKWFMYYYGGF